MRDLWGNNHPRQLEVSQKVEDLPCDLIFKDLKLVNLIRLDPLSISSRDTTKQLHQAWEPPNDLTAGQAAEACADTGGWGVWGVGSVGASRSTVKGSIKKHSKNT